VRYKRWPAPPVDRSKDSYSYDVAARMSQLYRWVADATECELILFYENDVVAPPETLMRLTECLRPNVGAVSALCMAKKNGLPQAWNYQSLYPPILDWETRIPVCVQRTGRQRTGREDIADEPMEIGTSAWSCLLVRRSALRKTVVRSMRPLWAHDGIFGWDLRMLGYKYILQPAARCRHYQTEAKWV